MDRAIIVRHFRQLDKMEMLQYREQTETPWISFTEDVVYQQNLRISPENYHHQKVVTKDRLDAFIGLIELKNQCRNTYLLNYFGVKPETDCGICDICIKKKKGKFSDHKYSNYIEKIQRFWNSGMRTEEIINQFPTDKKEEILDLLSFLSLIHI